MRSCENCGDSTSELVEHHTSYEDDETVLLCPSCHGRVHASEEHPLKPVDEKDYAGSMAQTTIRFPASQIEDMDEFVDSSHYTDRSEMIRAAVDRLIAKRGYGTLAQRLRHAADVIDEVADVAPEADYDESVLEEYEEEFGEVPDHGQILRQIAQVTRTAAINIEVHEDND